VKHPFSIKLPSFLSHFNLFTLKKEIFLSEKISDASGGKGWKNLSQNNYQL
jgi:hypothetical protein